MNAPRGYFSIQRSISHKFLRIALLSLIAFPHLTESLHAQTYHCDGIIQARPCGEEPAAAKNDSKKLSEDSTLPKRKLLFTDLDLEAFRARRDGRGPIGIEAARAECLAPNGSLSKCERLVNQGLTELKKREKALKKEKKKKEVAPVTENKTSVIVIQPETSGREIIRKLKKQEHKKKKQQRKEEQKLKKNKS